MRLRYAAEDRSASNERRHPEAPVRHAVVREDVGRNVQRTAHAKFDQHGAAERNGRRGHALCAVDGEVAGAPPAAGRARDGVTALRQP